MPGTSCLMVGVEIQLPSNWLFLFDESCLIESPDCSNFLIISLICPHELSEPTSGKLEEGYSLSKKKKEATIVVDQRHLRVIQDVVLRIVRRHRRALVALRVFQSQRSLQNSLSYKVKRTKSFDTIPHANTILMYVFTLAHLNQGKSNDIGYHILKQLENCREKQCERTFASHSK